MVAPMVVVAIVVVDMVVEPVAVVVVVDMVVLWDQSRYGLAVLSVPMLTALILLEGRLSSSKVEYRNILFSDGTKATRTYMGRESTYCEK